MKEIFKKMEISEDTINQMEELCPNIKELSNFEILQKIEVLQKINCNKMQIVNIISSNSLFLDRTNTDIDKLIKKMKELGFDTLNILFDANPYILNIDDFEIERYVRNRKIKGEKIENIIDDMSSNPVLFNDI